MYYGIDSSTDIKKKCKTCNKNVENTGRCTAELPSIKKVQTNIQDCSGHRNLGNTRSSMFALSRRSFSSD
jgi:hypothetical protein